MLTTSSLQHIRAFSELRLGAFGRCRLNHVRGFGGSRSRAWACTLEKHVTAFRAWTLLVRRGVASVC